MGLRRSDDRPSRSVSLLISMLVRYPEVATVRYEPEQQHLRVGLLISGDLSHVQWEELQEGFADTLEVYWQLSGRKPATLMMERESYGEMAAITIIRAADSLSPEEVYTWMEFFRDRLAGRLLTESVEFSGEEELLAQDELIEDLLHDMHEGRSGRNLIAIREDGRVMLFQK